MSDINFFSEDISFKPAHKKKIREWIQHIISSESMCSVKTINYIFCSDPYLLEINNKFLGHDNLTDIITFNHSNQDKNLESDIFISIDRVKENSANEQVSFQEELHRVMIHGILHLLGYKDKTEDEKEKMRRKENECLTLLQI